MTEKMKLIERLVMEGSINMEEAVTLLTSDTMLQPYTPRRYDSGWWGIYPPVEWNFPIPVTCDTLTITDNSKAMITH